MPTTCDTAGSGPETGRTSSSPTSHRSSPASSNARWRPNSCAGSKPSATRSKRNWSDSRRTRRAEIRSAVAEEQEDHDDYYDFSPWLFPYVSEFDEEHVPAPREPTEPIVDHDLGDPIIHRAALLALARHVYLDLTTDAELADRFGRVTIPLRIAIEIDEHLPDIVRRRMNGDRGFMTPHIGAES